MLLTTLPCLSAGDEVLPPNALRVEAVRRDVERVRPPRRHGLIAGGRLRRDDWRRGSVFGLALEPDGGCPDVVFVAALADLDELEEEVLRAAAEGHVLNRPSAAARGECDGIDHYRLRLAGHAAEHADFVLRVRLVGIGNAVLDG